MIYSADVKTDSGIVIIDGLITKRQGAVTRYPEFILGQFTVIVVAEKIKPIFIQNKKNKIIICCEDYLSLLKRRYKEFDSPAEV